MPVENAVSLLAGVINENCKKGLEWGTFPGTVTFCWFFRINGGVPGNLGRTQSFPSVAPGAGLPKENSYLRYGWAGLVKSRSSVNGMTIRALGVVEKPSNQVEMKHNSGNRRSRSRGGKQRYGGGGRNNYESNGPGGKVRGTAQQVLDKYLGLAQDAQSSGDRISAESFFQFAEHYFRVLNVDGGNANQGRRDKPVQSPEEPAALAADAGGHPRC